MSRKRAFWLPEEAYKARKGEENKNLVTYLAPNGSIRRYVCGENEARFYYGVFYGTNLSQE